MCGGLGGARPRRLSCRVCPGGGGPGRLHRVHRLVRLVRLVRLRRLVPAAVQHLRRGRHSLRGRVQHGAGAVPRLPRPALPGHPGVRRHGSQNRHAAERLRRRRRPELVLRGHGVHDHQALRPERPRQRPRRRADRRERRPGRRRDRQRAAGEGGRPLGLRGERAGRRGLPQRRHQRCRDRKPAAGRVHGDQWHARGQRVLLRLRQRRDLRHRHRQRPHGRDQLRYRVLVRRRVPGPGPGSRRTWRTASSPAATAPTPATRATPPRSSPPS